jgi:hypothetical protein
VADHEPPGSDQPHDLATYLEQHPDDVIDSDDHVSPAESIVSTCRRHGIALTLDTDGALKFGQVGGPTPWPSLLQALAAHQEAVAELVAAAAGPAAGEFPTASVPPPPDPPPPKPAPPTSGSSSRVTEVVARQLTRRYSRLAFWRRNATGELRTRIEQIIAEFKPVVDEHLISSRFDDLHDTLLDEQRQLDDCIRAHRNLGDGSPLE